MCCLPKTSAGMKLGYKSVLFILHFHLAGMNRGEPGRTVAPPWRTGVNRVSAGMNRGPAGALRASTVDRRDCSAKKRHFHPVHPGP